MGEISKRMQMLLQAKACPQEAEKLEKMGIKKKYRDNAAVLALSLFEKAALGRDVSAAKEVRAIAESGAEQSGVREIVVRITDA